MFSSLKVMNILLLMPLLTSEILTAEDNSIRLGLLGPTLGLSPTGGFLNNHSLDVEYDDDDDEDEEDEYAFDEESEYFIPEPLTALTDPFTETQQVELRVLIIKMIEKYFPPVLLLPRD